MKSYYKYLVYYYGLLQIVHLLVNFVVLFIPSFNAASLLSLDLDKEEFQILLSSSYVDFFVASPLGVVFAYGFIKKKQWNNNVGIISLTAALISALLYTYLLLAFNAWEFNLVNLLINLAFIPPFVLYFLLLKNKLR